MTTMNPTPGELVSAKTICLCLKIGSFGNSKQASLADVTVDADKTLLRLTKTLLDSPELKNVQLHDRDVAARVRKMAFSSLFKGGVYMLPLTMVPQAEEILQEGLKTRKGLIDLACDNYALRTEETSLRLGVTYNPADYPSLDRFRESFYFEYSYVTFETPSRLKAISAAIFEKEKEKAQARLTAVADECQQAMRTGLADLVDHLAERLTPGADGKSKRLSGTTITNLNDFLGTFDLRNVTDDAELGMLVAKARNVMEGIDHTTLKKDALIAQKVAQELSALKLALDPLIVEKGNRSISLQDDAEAV